MLRGERVVHRIPGDFANRSARDNERSLEKEEEERRVSCRFLHDIFMRRKFVRDAFCT